MNLRPSGYEPDELPDCSTPRQVSKLWNVEFQEAESIAVRARQAKSLWRRRPRAGAGEGKGAPVGTLCRFRSFRRLPTREKIPPVNIP